MKLGIIFLFLANSIYCSVGGEIALLVDTMTKSNTVFQVTNSTGRQVFILPVCLPEQFYPKDFYCSNCAPRWGAAAPVALGKWRDLIPLPSGKSFDFTFNEYYGRRWRITCFAWTQYFNINEPNSSFITNKLEFHSIEFPAGRPYFTLIPTNRP